MAQTTMFRDFAIDGATMGAEDIARVFRSLFGATTNSGPLKGALNEFAVTAAGATRQISVASGQAMVYGFWYENSATHTFSLTENASGNPRYDRIIARLTFATQSVGITSITGTPAASPAVPALVQDATSWDIPLANVYVANGATEFTSGNITDARDFCTFAQEPTHQGIQWLLPKHNLGTQVCYHGAFQEVDMTADLADSEAEGAIISVFSAAWPTLNEVNIQIYVGQSPGGHWVGTWYYTTNEIFSFTGMIPIPTTRKFWIYVYTDQGAGSSITVYPYLLGYTSKG